MIAGAGTTSATSTSTPVNVRATARRHLRPDELVTVAVTTAAAARADFERAAIGAPRVVAFDAY